MLLNDISQSPDTVLKRINGFLEANFGIRLKETSSLAEVDAISETIHREIYDLKLMGENPISSPEISKRLLILEGLRSVRESAMLGAEMKSPQYDFVVDQLADFVVNTFTISGMQQTDFDSAVARAMDEYRSSKYRFPDSVIQADVTNKALDTLNLGNVAGPEIDISAPLAEDDLDESPWDTAGKRASPYGGHPADPNQSLPGVLDKLDDGNFSLAKDDSPVPMVRDHKTGRMVPDPFAQMQHQRRTTGIIGENNKSPNKTNPRGTVMKENLVKNLRRLLETEVSQAEVMMAAKGFAQELQEMIEKIGRLQNEDLPPVTDQMRETYGMESASAFQTQIYGALQSVMDSLYTAKSQVDDAVSDMALTGRVGAKSDMDLDVDGMDPAADEMGEPVDSPDLDLDNIGEPDDMGGEMDDEMDDMDNEPLGRAMKESMLQRKIVEMARLVEKARKLKEAKRIAR